MRLTSVLGIACSLVALGAPAWGRQRPAAPPRQPPAAVPAETVLAGYRTTVSGATMEYHSPHPEALSSLLARALRGIQVVSWETDTVPAGVSADTVSFVWIMGLAGSKGVQRFDLSVNGRQRFSFTTAADSSSRGFSIPGPNGSSFSFRVTMVDRYGDLFGYATLRLARQDAGPGRPVRVEVRGEDAGSRAWYMTFQHRLTPRPRIQQNPVLVRGPAGAEAELRVLIDNLAGGGAASVEIPGRPAVPWALVPGGNVIRLPAGPAAIARDQRVIVRVAGAVALDTTVRLVPVAQRDFYVLPYSHNDIGYSDLQVNVERLQWRILEEALRLVERTRDYPAEARYKWNVEVLWPVETWLAQAAPEQRARFVAAVREGSIGLNAFLGGVQSGLATAPEMPHFFDFARRLRDRDSLPVETAVISDIPGQSWGIVTALRNSGIRWFALAPNNGDRTGYTIETWGDRPFWWTSQSGRDSVLMWVAGASYSLFHDAAMRQGGERKLYGLMRRLESAGSPYQAVQLPYTINGDNGPNDPDLSDYVRDWNVRYVSPRLVIATHAQLFRDFEARHGRDIPTASGDFTTYWDDGVASTAAEVALVRRASDRLVQAEALWAMRDHTTYPADAFYAAWREVVLWDEHTWGAATSVETPDAPDVRTQWEYKRAFAVRADSLSREMLARALELPLENASVAGTAPAIADAFEVHNTTSWPRTEVVYVPAELSRAGDRVLGPGGRPVPSQRLSRGQLAVLVRDLPPLTGRRYTVRTGSSWAGDGPGVRASGSTLESALFRVEVDTLNGAISSLVWKPRNTELVDRRARGGLGEYLYVPGRDSTGATGVSGVRIQVREAGPLVAALSILSNAPGARALLRDVTIVDGIDRVDFSAVVDKAPVREKEGVHFAFPFRVPDGQVRFDVASGIVRPDSEQLLGSLRNFVTVQSWADVSNDSLGVTWATPGAPLVEIGGIFAELPWMRSIPRTQTVLSYVMNNYWHTNFKADQAGPVAFQYALRPHGSFRPEEAVRLGAERRALLVVAPARGAPPLPSLLRLEAVGLAVARGAAEPSPVVVTSVRPTSDRRGWLVALFNPTAEEQQVRFAWRPGERIDLSHSDSGERPGAPVLGALALPAHGTATVRAERTIPEARRSRV